nr:DUF296 domain-containing protein [Segniliparus rugosus]
MADGDELFTALNDFAVAHNVHAGSFTAVGALRDVRYGWYDISRKQYRVIPAQGQVEALSITGDIGVSSGKPTVHTHLTVGHEDGSVTGGHLLYAIASPTVEVFARTYPTDLPKALDERSGLFLFGL